MLLRLQELYPAIEKLVKRVQKKKETLEDATFQHLNSLLFDDDMKAQLQLAITVCSLANMLLTFAVP
jgi:hypothetical protein